MRGNWRSFLAELLIFNINYYEELLDQLPLRRLLGGERLAPARPLSGGARMGAPDVGGTVELERELELEQK